MMRLHNGDCLNILKMMIEDEVFVDSIVTDPPYHLTSIVERFGKDNSAPAQYGTDGAFKRHQLDLWEKNGMVEILHLDKKLGNYV